MNDHIKADFYKEISDPLVKLVYEAILNTKEQIDYQTKVQATTYDDTQDVNPADFVPLFPDDFNFGVTLGWTDPWKYDIGKTIFRFFYNDPNYVFFERAWFNWWILGTKTI